MNAQTSDAELQVFLQIDEVDILDFCPFIHEISPNQDQGNVRRNTSPGSAVMGFSGCSRRHTRAGLPFQSRPVAETPGQKRKRRARQEKGTQF